MKKLRTRTIRLQIWRGWEIVITIINWDDKNWKKEIKDV